MVPVIDGQRLPPMGNGDRAVPSDCLWDVMPGQRNDLDYQRLGKHIRQMLVPTYNPLSGFCQRHETNRCRFLFTCDGLFRCSWEVSSRRCNLDSECENLPACA